MTYLHVLALAPVLALVAQAGVGHDIAAVEMWKTVGLVVVTVCAPIAIAYGKLLLAGQSEMVRRVEQVDTKTQAVGKQLDGRIDEFLMRLTASAAASEKRHEQALAHAVDAVRAEARAAASDAAKVVAEEVAKTVAARQAAVDSHVEAMERRLEAANLAIQSSPPLSRVDWPAVTGPPKDAAP